MFICHLKSKHLIELKRDKVKCFVSVNLLDFKNVKLTKRHIRTPKCVISNQSIYLFFLTNQHVEVFE